LERGAAVSLRVLAILAWSWPFAALAQGAGGAPVPDDKPTVGMRLFNQHCRVCHTKPLLTSGQYGPVLSKNSLGGEDAALHDFIANGTPRMPGFMYDFVPTQIDAIVAYLKTVPATTASAQ
jgi:mono/diheme cytochrome c family protein